MKNIKLPYSDILPCGVCEFEKIGELIECRAKSRVPENAKSVIVYLFPYWLGEDFYKNSNISKYAVPPDYHIIAGEYLKKITEELKSTYPQYNFQWFCDNSPIKEVRAGVLSGVGVRGKNTLLINKYYGSFCFIGEIVTDMVLPYNEPKETECLNCNKCVESCPNKAISQNGVNIEKCLSDITQRKGELSQSQKKLIEESKYIWGCDICQDVCPMNKNLKITPLKEFLINAKATYEKGDSIDGRAFSWRGEKVIERNFLINSCKDKKNKL